MERFGAKAGLHVMKTVQLASRVLPRIVAASVPYSMFPTTTGWPEMMHLGSLPRYAQQEEGSDIQQFMNVREEATSILEGTDTAMRRPGETSRWFAETSDAILAEAAAAERIVGEHTGSNELKTCLRLGSSRLSRRSHEAHPRSCDPSPLLAYDLTWLNLRSGKKLTNTNAQAANRTAGAEWYAPPVRRELNLDFAFRRNDYYTPLRV
jgi:hypothetical protein